MSSDLVVDARGIAKNYRLFTSPQERFKHLILSRFGRSYGRGFWALRDITFQVRRGETFGVIGRNGSGKSTLLQILAGILSPTQGEVQVNGRVAALLELGSGFNPEFTGRENVLHYGSILGIPRAEMREHLDEILAFADIGEFVDQPVKTYSSGMFVRLAFAAAAGVNADLLLIDEALAVGDVFFRQKCYQHLDKLRQRGVAIILVSHSMNEVEQFCESALLLHDSRALFLGSAVDAVKRYYLVEQGYGQGPAAASVPLTLQPAAAPLADLSLDPSTAELPVISSGYWPAPDGFLSFPPAAEISTGTARCTGVAVLDPAGQPRLVFEQGETASFYYEFLLAQPIQSPLGGVQLQNDKGMIVHGKTTLEYGGEVPGAVEAGHLVRFRQDISLELAIGEYTFEIGFAAIPAADFLQRAQMSHTDLYSRVTRILTLTNLGPLRVIARRPGSSSQLLHHGIANLPGSSRCEVV